VNNYAFAYKIGRLEPFKVSIVALAASLCIAVPTSSGASIETIFDQTASKLEASRDGKGIDNLSGKIAWGIAYELDALIDMYLATGKEKYLAKFVPLCDRVVAARADKMGQLDFKGRLCAGWLTNGHYTQGEPVVLLSAHGQPSIEIQTCAHSYNNETTIQVIPDGEEKFSLHVTGHSSTPAKSSLRFDGLTVHTAEERVNPKPGQIGYTRVRRLGNEPPRSCGPFTPPTARIVLHGHHTGRIVTPMARFAALVKARPQLSSHADAAARFLRCAEEAAMEMETLWRTEGDFGYLIFERNTPFWCDGAPEPYNCLSASGVMYLALHDATAKGLYLEHATRLARLTKAGLRLQDDGTLFMYYWWGKPLEGWQPTDNVSVNTPLLKPKKTPEDTSHLQHTIRFMAECQERGIVFDVADLQRMAATFNKRIYREQGGNGLVACFIDGTDGSHAPGKFNNMVYGWLKLVRVDRSVYAKCRSMYEQRSREAAESHVLYGWAMLAQSLPGLQAGHGL